MNMTELAAKIIGGYRLDRERDAGILSAMIACDLGELQRGAGEIQKHFCGANIDLCSIINGRSGRCPEDCKYCAQASRHHTDAKCYDFLPADEICAMARHNQEAGLNRFSIVTSGRALTGDEFERAIAVYERMHRELTIKLCASMRFLSREQLRRLKDAGVENYHCNLETSRRHFPKICTTHTYDDKIAELRLAQSVGLNVCSGGIIGMGESFEDRIDMALDLAALGVKSIPVNVLMPIKGTPLENLPQISADDALRTIAIFRYINPEANVRLAAGRKVLPGCGETAFRAGASATISGDMLTTSGTTIAGDVALARRLRTGT